MKLVKQSFASLLFSLVLMVSFSASGQSANETIITEKCEQCQDYMTYQNIEAYAKGNCRIYQSVCNVMNDENTIRLSEQEPVIEQVITETSVNLVFFLENFDRRYDQLTPVVTLLDEDNNTIEEVKTRYFQQYTFDENQKIIATKGVKNVKVTNEQTELLTTTLSLPDSYKKAAFIKVEMQIIHPQTNELLVVKSLNAVVSSN